MRFFQVEVVELPTTHIVPRQIRLGLSLTLFGLIVSLPTVGLIRNIITGSFVIGMLPLLAFTIFGWIFLLFGLFTLTAKTKISFTAENVVFDLQALFDSKSWSEPLQNFQGVRCWSQRRSGGRHSISYTLYKIELHHTDKAKCILLYQSTSRAGIFGIQADYCKLFRLPAINDYGIGSVVRPINDLEKSVVDLAQTGQLLDQVVFADHLAQGMETVEENDEVRIELPKIKPNIGFVVIWALITSVMLVIWLTDTKRLLMLGVIGIIFALVLIAYVLWLALTREVIRINQNSISISYQTRWGEKAGFRIELDQLESVQIGHPENSRPLGILLITNAMPKMFAQGLPEYELEKIKDRILTIIAKQVTKKKQEW